MTKLSPIERSSIEEARRNLSRTTVLAVGVHRYRHLPPLPGAAKDLQLIAKLFVEDPYHAVYEKRHFTSLSNPTVEKVRSAITDYIRSRSAHGDILIFYFSGHGTVVGTSNFAFCLSDTTTSPFSEGGLLPISLITFRDIVQTLSAADVHPVFIIDACFSAASARGYDAKLTSVMHDDLHTFSAGSYGLLCSSYVSTASIDTDAGGAFTNALCATVNEGFSSGTQRHWPYVTLRGLSQPLQERLTNDGSPLSKQYLGPDLPDIPIAKNVLYRPLTVFFAPYMCRILAQMWNHGSPKEVHHEELRNGVGPGAYGNHSKLSLLPWGLVEDGSRKRTRRLTSKGVKFMQGKAKIPDRIVKDPVHWEWVAAPDAKMILIGDVPYAERMI